MDVASLRQSSFPMFDAVESLDARVISKLPFRPSKAGTITIIGFTCVKTGQACTRLSTSPAATIPRPATRKVGKICITRARLVHLLPVVVSSSEATLGTGDSAHVPPILQDLPRSPPRKQ